MSHVLVTSVHRIHAGRSGQAIHLRQLVEALRAVGERVTVLDGPMDPGSAGAGHGAGLRSLAEQLATLLARDRPDAALIWGHLGEETELARRLAAAGVPTVLEHPAADLQPVPETLRLVDEVVVPSEFARQLFTSQAGREARVIEPCLRGCDCPAESPRHLAHTGPYWLTFINPEPAKGLGVVMHLVAAVSGAGLPFRFRFVEGRWTASDLARLGIDPANLPGVEIVEYRTDICALYAETDLLLVPSLWQESFGMVAREAVIHGVPVVATRVGGLPQAVGAGGVCLEPPECGDHYQVRMTAAEVRTWLAAVVTALRGAHRPQPELLSRATSDSVRAYRAVLCSSPG
ncbi:glycosyltransferase [Micromonospora sp. WMMD1082]|uniref:glycosyltransferase n=1 Tax=Micromonospora sp. WMMD1082 TaxID=3016104 RepID=UPI0024160067|nr:glycosyltransferase [Micromonospora sp. WMMD1082]MDG4796331.1 glycosyltransferase [Micromonospora sp. WMMD1082]